MRYETKDHIGNAIVEIRSIAPVSDSPEVWEFFTKYQREILKIMLKLKENCE